VKHHVPCDQEISDTSDMLCSCRLPDAPASCPASVPAAPVQAAPCCASYSQWPHVDNGVTCDACTALVLTEPYGGRCDEYCASFGHVCVAAAEETAENCDVKHHVPCDQEVSDTSDMLCTCRLPEGSTCPPSGSPPVPVPTPSPVAVLPPAAPGGRPHVQVQGRQVLVNGQPLHLKGVAWNPVPRGGVHPNDVDFAGFVDQDALLMQRAGINAVRTYVTIEDTHVLDKLQEHGIWVLNDVYAYGGTAAEVAVDRVRSVKDHPAILMWTVGNEWNYNGLYVNMGSQEALNRVHRVASLVKAEDPTRPVASIYGEVPSQQVFQRLDSVVDVWGLNVYRGLSFGNIFDVFASRSGKPMFFGEYGADAFNANIHREDQEAQAEATRALTNKIMEKSSMLPSGVCLGGFIFEFADEWWKDHSGNKNVHDTGGVAPGGGPHPDSTFNEEWWGLVEIDRRTRLAYDAYADVQVPQGSPRP